MAENETNFTHILEALTNYNQPFPPRMLRNFSDLTSLRLRELKAVWPALKRERKIALLEDLETVAESDTLVNFDELAKMSLSDEDPSLRVLSIRLLWECEESRLVPIFTEMMLSDPAEDVRAAAASALGKFVYLGELDAIPDALRISSLQNLFDVVSGEDLSMVRRRALESLGYSSHSKVPALIQNALAKEDTQWLTSALYAIGRSADEKWSEVVLSHLDSPDSEVKFEAVRAAGEITLEDAREPLFDILETANDDQELRFAVIWSLSQIGGQGVKRKLEEMVKRCTDDEEGEWLEKALENLELGGDLDSMEMLELDEDQIDSDEEEDLDDYDEEDLPDEDIEDEEFEN